MAEYVNPTLMFEPGRVQAQTGYNRALTEQLLMGMERARRQQAARAALGPIIMGLGQEQQGGGGIPQPPMPGQPSVPAVQAQMPAAPPPLAAAPMVPPYQSLPQVPEGMPEEGAGVGVESEAAPGGEIPSPPAEGAAAPGPGEASLPRTPGQAGAGQQFNLANLIKSMKQNGVPDAQVMDMLDAAEPIMSAQNRQELALLKAHNTALQQAQKVYMDAIKAATGQQNAETRARDVDSRIRDRDERNRIRQADLERKLRAKVGGADNLKRTDFEKDADGNIIGVVGVTKSGKVVRMDMEGNERSPGAPVPGTGPKADQNRVRQINALRGELNTLSTLQMTTPTPARKARMDQIEAQLREIGSAAAPKPGGGGAPAPGSAAPARPTRVPAGSAYSPSRKQWRDPAGKLYTADGAPIA